MRKNKKALGIIRLSLIALVAGIATAWLAGFRVNVTSSFPEGIWRIESGPCAKGMIVMFCPPDDSIFRVGKKRNYIPNGMCPGWYAPLIKRIVAVSGDHVVVSKVGVFVNGVKLKNSGLLETDSAGRPLPPAQSGIVPQGFVWLMSDYNPQSFDSRYFGAVSVKQIKGPAKLELRW
jgi:conjugative transfer signal peptidase TraF